MAKIPFKVSARTARLIGRENIASSKGAIVELVKNCYDADSPMSIIYFDRKITLDKDNQKIDNTTLYIIDAGEGMTDKIIRNHWMTIGTSNKESDFFTQSGRLKSGAKGIGRFALDKLGDKCEMVTKFNPEVHQDIDENGEETNYKAYLWDVNWSDFEGDFKTIDQVNATLIGSKDLDLKKYILDEISDDNLKEVISNLELDHGTIFKISNLRDNWEDFYVEQLFNDLEVLIPPRENSPFKIYLFSHECPDKYGQILGSICDDYDYKLTAKANNKQEVEITIFRNEYVVESINPKLFDRDVMKEFPYTKDIFLKGYWTKKTTFNELLEGFSKMDTDDTFSKIGSFEFTFYFMKKTFASDDLKKFYYKTFKSHERRDWLNKFGGIKLFRDEFRVRPYGESNNSAFDWLGLGNRQAQSPAAVSKKDGGWRVGPDNVAGAINISRIGNLDFQDKSSREGLLENKTFLIFKKIILKILEVFEEDRANIAKEMKILYEEIDDDSKSKKYADELAQKILHAERDKQKDSTLFSKANEKIESDKVILSKRLEDKNEEIESLKEEQKLLRGMASSGIVVAAFSHDLSKISQNLNSRVEKLKKILQTYISDDDIKGVEDRKNPLYLLERMRKQDLKLQNWLHFSLGVARKDKRKMETLRFKSYLSLFKEDWQTIFLNRGITFDTEVVGDLSMRIYEIDMDSIFNNLLVNTINAFNESLENKERKIIIRVYDTDYQLIIDYEDSGPGLSKDIKNPEKIFDSGFTTNLNMHTGEKEGTGLGMWIVKSIIEDNDGKVQLIYPDNGGFGLRIIFPKKYIRNK